MLLNFGNREVVNSEPVAEQLIQGGQSLKLSTEAAVFKRVSLLIGGGKHVDWGSQAPLGTGRE